MSESLISPFLWVNRSPKINEWYEQITQVAHQKWATISDSLRSLRGNEQSWAKHSGHSPKKSNLLRSLRGNERSWANRSGCSPKMSEWVNHLFFLANRSFTHFWAKNEQFAWKLISKFPALRLTELCWIIQLSDVTNKHYWTVSDSYSPCLTELCWTSQLSAITNKHYWTCIRLLFTLFNWTMLNHSVISYG